MGKEKIEILSVELLERHRREADAFRELSRRVGISLGWHYLLDLVWILENLGDPQGRHIMDAGAGLGLMQWHLAERGVDVLSVDRSDRSEMLRLRTRYRIAGLRPEDIPGAGELLRIKTGRAASLPGRALAWLRGAAGLLAAGLARPSGGLVTIYNQDLQDLRDIPAASLDAVIAVSALEHNAPEDLPKVVKELMRVLRPGGVLLATLGAARDKDWFHGPSQGWCYTDATLRKAFGLSGSVPSNYSRHDELLTGLRNCTELREELAPLYFESGDNGMPWGKWDPQYQPVGVCKVKG